MKKLILIILFTLLPYNLQAKELDLGGIQWGLSSQETQELLQGKLVGTIIVINKTFKGYPSTFECRFRDDKLYAMIISPRSKKDSGDHYTDFLTIITQLAKQYGKPKLDNEQQISQADWITPKSKSHITLAFKKNTWVLVVHEKKGDQQ